jgi:hypothetical protein
VRLGLAAYDFFPIEGALKSYERAQKVYGLFGNDAQKNLDYAIALTTHTYGADLRRAAVNFFRRSLRGESETFARQEDPEVLPPAALNATQSGQVLIDFRGCKTVTQLLTQNMRDRLPATPRDFDASTVAGVLGIGESPTGDPAWTGEPRRRTIYPRIIENVVVEGYRTEKIFFFTEPDVCCTAIYIHPRDESKVSGTEIVLFEEGTNAIPSEKPRLRQLLEAHRRVFVFDVRGVGGVKTRRMCTPEDYSRHGTEYRLAIDAMKLKTSTLGLRVFDVLRAVDYLGTRADAGTLSITGIGVASAWALYAAVLETRLEAVRLERALVSYRAAAATRFYDDANFNLRMTAFGLLSAGDVADLVKMISPRVVKMVNTLTPEGTPAGASGSGAVPGVK